MRATATTWGTLIPVDEQRGQQGDRRARGKRIAERLDALGISAREFHDRTGISRNTVASAVGGGEKVRPQTFAAIEAALDRLEGHVTGAGVTQRPIGDPAEGMVELEFEESPGRRVVVKGPVRDLAALEQSLSRLVNGMKLQDKDSDDS